MGRNSTYGRYVYYHYWGGLGDVLYLMMHDKCRYNLLADFGPRDRATVSITSPNLNAKELFECHPKASQIKVMLRGWVNEADARSGNQKPWMRFIPQADPPQVTDRLIFYPTPKDQEVLDEIGDRPHIIVAPTAAGRPRCFPDWLTKKVIRIIVANGALPVFIGASYKVQGYYPYKVRKPYHGEPEHNDPQIFSAINRLTVPGSLYAITHAAGMIGCYSSMCVGAFTVRKRQLVFTNDRVANVVYEGKNHLPCVVADKLCKIVRFQDPCVNRIIDDYVKSCLERIPQEV